MYQVLQSGTLDKPAVLTAQAKPGPSREADDRQSRSRHKAHRSHSQASRVSESSDSDLDGSHYSARRSWRGSCDDRSRAGSYRDDGGYKHGYYPYHRPDFHSVVMDSREAEAYYRWRDGDRGFYTDSSSRQRKRGRSPPAAAAGAPPLVDMTVDPAAKVSKHTDRTTALPPATTTALPLTTAQPSTSYASAQVLGNLPTSQTATHNTDAVSVRASNSEIDSDQDQGHDTESRGTAAPGTSEFGDNEDEDPGAPTTSKSSSSLAAKEHGFTECIEALFKEFNSTDCPPPPEPTKIATLAQTKMKSETSANRAHTAPLSLLVTKNAELLEKEVKGKVPGKQALTVGKWPLMKSSPRSKSYRTHTPMLATNWPVLDKDSAKIDSDPHSFKAVSIDRSSFHQLGGSSRNLLRALSLHDWFMGLASMHRDDDARYVTCADAAARCIAFAAEVALRQHMTLMLMEREAWLERPSVQLSNELKQTARLAPFDSQWLFGDTLAELAKSSAADKQTEMLLHGAANKQSKFTSPKAPTAARSTTSQSPGKGKSYKKGGYKKSFKAKGQTSQKSRTTINLVLKVRALGTSAPDAQALIELQAPLPRADIPVGGACPFSPLNGNY